MKRNNLDPNEIKQQIIKVVGQKIFVDGFKKITMDEIAVQLHISKKTLYKHFVSKEDLFRAISLSYLNESYTIIIAIIQANTNIVEKFIGFSNMVEDYYRLFNDHSLLALKSSFPHIALSLEEFRKSRVVPLIKLLLKIGKKKKMILDIPDEIIFRVFTAALGSIAGSKLGSFSHLSYHQTFRYAFNFLLNGILTKKGKQILNYKSKVIK